MLINLGHIMKSYFFLNLCCDTPYEIWLVFKYCVIYRYLFLGFDIVNQVEKSTWRNQILDIRILKLIKISFLLKTIATYSCIPRTWCQQRVQRLWRNFWNYHLYYETPSWTQRWLDHCPPNQMLHIQMIFEKRKKKHLKKNAEK